MAQATPVMTQEPSRGARLAATLLFLALLAAPVIYGRMNQPGGASGVTGEAPGPPSISPQQALQRYGFYLTACTRRCGIDFVHRAPQLDPKLSNIMPEVASMGASVSICDYDNDGWPDIYVTTSAVGGQNHLYHNNHDGTFTDVAKQMGVADLNRAGAGVCMGAVWGDYDNDGYEDLLVYKWGKCLLFHNDHGRKFTDVTAGSGLPAWANINSAIWLDYNRDGKLDLLLCGYYPDNVDLFHLTTTRMMPNSFEYASNGGRKYLLRNMGGGRFEDVTAQVGLDSHRWTLACAAADLRGAGYPDIFLANDYGESQIYENLDGKRFKEVAKQALYWGGAGPKSGMNAAFGDILNQGKLSVYVSNISEPGQLVQGNDLWVPSPNQPPGQLKYNDLATQMGVDLGGWSFGAQFGDLNNSGSLDIVLTNGFYSGKPDQSYWYDFGKVAGGSSAIISDAANWPDMRGRSLSGRQSKHLWLGDGEGDFTDVAQMVGFTDRYDGRAVALADLFNNGSLDILEANQRGPLLIYKNTVNPHNNWIELHLLGARSNRSAIGAEVTMYWNGREQRQVINGGSGFCAENDRRVHFGLGSAARVDKVVIHWPSGVVQTLPPPRLNAITTITEPS